MSLNIHSRDLGPWESKGRKPLPNATFPQVGICPTKKILNGWEPKTKQKTYDAFFCALGSWPEISPLGISKHP